MAFSCMLGGASGSLPSWDLNAVIDPGEVVRLDVGCTANTALAAETLLAWKMQATEAAESRGHKQ